MCTKVHKGPTVKQFVYLTKISIKLVLTESLEHTEVNVSRKS